MMRAHKEVVAEERMTSNSIDMKIKEMDANHSQENIFSGQVNAIMRTLTTVKSKVGIVVAEERMASNGLK